MVDVNSWGTLDKHVLRRTSVTEHLIREICLLRNKNRRYYNFLRIIIAYDLIQVWGKLLIV